MDRSSPEWDLDSDEIASVASQDLHDNRPNRWTGSQATWRRMTAEERRLWHSMKLLEDQDLALHLYDAFALKRRGRDAETAQDLTVTMENGQQGIWAPPKVWTAWPLDERRVPEQRLLRGDDDDDDDEDNQFTFRKAEQRMPGSELQEELAATILRLARERFHKRKKTVLASIEEDDSSGPLSGNESGKMAVEEEEEAEAEGEDDNASQQQPRGRSSRTPNKTYDPVMSTNDELSYELLRPSVRHILSQLDTTLKMLHNARVATADYASDSSATDEESDSQSGPRRGRGRPRSTPQPGDYTDNSPQPDGGTATARRRGRPKKVHVPREGETHEEMLVRIARQSHRRLPSTSMPTSTAAAAQDDKNAAFEEWLRKGDERLAQERTLLAEEEDLGIGPGAGLQERRIRKLGLRDWGDVVGAAALAGFSSKVVARTARRCADLFGQGVVVRRLDEVPAGREPGFQSVEYRPEKIQPGELMGHENDDDSDNVDDADIESGAETAASSRRTLSRRPSPSSPYRGRSSPHSPSSRRSPSRSRSRSRSSAGFFLCPIPSCERAATGFSRRQNLRRHMQLVHPGRREPGGEEDGPEEEEGDSEDEVFGAVHVDGFLKPIFPTRGWRQHISTNPLVRKRAWEKQAAVTAAGVTLQSRETSPGDAEESSW